jgi:hypothetical protein
VGRKPKKTGQKAISFINKLVYPVENLSAEEEPTEKEMG